MRADVIQAIAAGIYGVIILIALVWAIKRLFHDLKKEKNDRQKNQV